MKEELQDERAAFGVPEAVLKQKAEAKVKQKPSEAIRLAINRWCKEVERAQRTFKEKKTEVMEVSLRLADMYKRVLTGYVYKDLSPAEARRQAMEYMFEKYGEDWERP